MTDSTADVCRLTAISRYLSWPVVVVVLWSLVVPAAGMPLFFRNEAGDHLEQIHNNSLAEVMAQRWRSTNFRPTAYLVWWMVDRLFGLSAAAYLCVNVIFYVFSMLMLYKLAQRFWGIAGGLGAVCSYQVSCFFLEYSLYNAVYGIFFPMLMAFLLGAVWFFFEVIEEGRGKFGFILFSSLALLTHSFAAVLLPAICFAVALFPPVKPAVELRRRVFGCAVLTALCAAVFPFIQDMSGQAPPAAPLEFLSFTSVRFWKALQIFSYGTVGLFGLIGVVALLADNVFRRIWFLKALSVLLVVIAADTVCGLFSFQLFVMFLIYLWMTRPSLRWLIAWCAVALGLYLGAHDMVSAYLQPFGIACAMLFGAQFAQVAGKWRRERGPPRVLVYVRASMVVTALLGFVVVLGVRTFEIPVLSRIYRPVAQVRQVSYNLRDFIHYARENIRDSTIVVVAPYHRVEAAEIYSAREMAGRGAYGGDYGGYLKAFGVQARAVTWSLQKKPFGLDKCYVVALDRRGFELVSGKWALEPDVVFGTELEPVAIVKPFAHGERGR